VNETTDAVGGFAFSLPESWFEIDVRPATRDTNIKMLVEHRVHDQPELWEHRAALVKLLRRQAREAWDAGAVYCACFAIVVEEALIPGAITVSVIPPPPGGALLDAIVESLPSRDAASDGEPFALRSVVEIDGIGRVARSQGITDVQLPGGGWIRSLTMQTFVPVDGERIILIGAASPALDLIEPLFELFDAVTSTFRLVRSDPAG
jgi:hypothetical protein